MRYRCLVLDHDDTAVRSTPEIHYPSFMRTMHRMRPSLHMTLDQFFLLNFDPGFNTMCRCLLHMTDEEIKIQEADWRRDVRDSIPTFHPGIRELIMRQKKENGYLCVVSHSYSEYILRDYRENDVPAPDLVFGWDAPEELRKPNPYPLDETMRALSLTPDELLVADDLKPGLDMAKSRGVAFACAGWGNCVPQIETYMRAHCDHYFRTTAEFCRFASGLEEAEK